MQGFGRTLSRLILRHYPGIRLGGLYISDRNFHNPFEIRNAYLNAYKSNLSLLTFFFSLNPWSRVLLEKLTVTQLVSNFPVDDFLRLFILVNLLAILTNVSFGFLQSRLHGLMLS
jgi:hypothetical protein